MQRDEKVINPRCDKGGRKGILILCMVGRSTFIDYLPKLSCCALLLALELWYSCNFNLNHEITNSGSSLRLLAISIIFVNYMVVDLVVEWMWLDAVYEFCGGEVTSDMRMKMRREIRHKHKTDFYFIPGWTFSCSLRNHLRWEWWDDYTNQGNYEDVALLNCTRKQIIHLVLIKIFLTGNDTSIHDAYSESFFYTNGSSVDYM